jgi:uncharacterized damage-inducible protein DinB
MTPDDIRLLYEFNAWANHRILDACAPLSASQFTQHIEASFPSVRDTVVHICAAEWIWLERWKGRSPVKAEWDAFAKDFTGLQSIRDYRADLEAKQMEFVAGITPESLAQGHSFRTLDGTPYTQPLWQMMQHVVNHSSYHRGQVTMMLRQLDAKPIGTDLIAFYRERAAKQAAG